MTNNSADKLPTLESIWEPREPVAERRTKDKLPPAELTSKPAKPSKRPSKQKDGK
jgi:hypothetical protein